MTQTYLIEFEYSQLDLLLLVFDLLWRGVILLLALFCTTPESKHEMQCRFLLDVVVRQRSAIFQLFAGKNQPLLIRRNS